MAVGDAARTWSSSTSGPPLVIAALTASTSAVAASAATDALATLAAAAAGANSTPLEDVSDRGASGGVRKRGAVAPKRRAGGGS